MDNYQPYDVTEQARTVAAAHPMRAPQFNLFHSSDAAHSAARRPRPRRESTATAHERTGHSVTLGRKIDMRYVAQLVDSGQTQALARALLYATPSISTASER